MVKRRCEDCFYWFAARHRCVPHCPDCEIGPHRAERRTAAGHRVALHEVAAALANCRWTCVAIQALAATESPSSSRCLLLANLEPAMLLMFVGAEGL
jgi:hypothetical protein